MIFPFSYLYVFFFFLLEVGALEVSTASSFIP